MNAYRAFMDRQSVSELTHQRLLALTAPKRQPQPWARWGTLAACLTLVAAAGLFALGRPANVAPPMPSGPVAAATPSAAPGPEDQSGRSFVAQGPSQELKVHFPAILGVEYADVTLAPLVQDSIARSPGSFDVELTKDDILKLFWGPEGKPPVDDPKTDPGDFPLFLMNWQGYQITATAMYDEQGDLWQLNIYGEKGEDHFTLYAAPGHIPPTCVVETGAAVTTVLGTEVKGWYRARECGSEFLTKGVGYRFENTGSGGMRSGGDEATDLDGAIRFNQMVVNHLCRADGGLYLDEIAHADAIPAWRQEQFDTLAQAREQAAFAPYLPQTAPADFGEFDARHSYQEGSHDWLSVRWSRGYDDVDVTVWLPEDPQGYPQSQPVVDVNVPESYDWQLYDGPICDTVPEEYQLDFYSPTFRAQDMSLAVVESRGHEKDTGGLSYHFRVLHPDGTVVTYDCSAVTAQYVWSLVEATL